MTNDLITRLESAGCVMTTTLRAQDKDAIA